MKKIFFVLFFFAFFLIPMKSHSGLADAPWPSLYRDGFNSGYTVHRGPTARLLEVTSRLDINGGLGSPVIGRDGTLYVGSSNGSFYAVKEGTKQVLFRAEAAIDSGAAISDRGVIYFGSIDGRFHAVRLNGEPVWSIDLGREINTAPAIGPMGKIFIVSTDQPGRAVLNCVGSDGTVLWQRVIDPVVVNSSPAVDASGNVYTAAVTGTISCFTNNGIFLWSHDLGTVIVSSIVIGTDGATLYCATVESLSALRYSRSEGGARLLWQYKPETTILGQKVPSGFLSSPAVVPGTDASGKAYSIIVIGGILGDVHCIEDKAGTHRVLWSTSLNPRFSVVPRIVSSAPVIGRLGNIYIRTGKYFHVLDKDGRIQRGDFSALTTEVEGMVDSPLAMGSNRTIYFVGGDGFLYALGSSRAGFSISGSISGDFRGAGVYLEGAVGTSADVNPDDGTYRMSSLIPGNYLVVPFRQGVAFDPPTQEVTISNADVSGVNFTATRVGPSIASAYSDMSEVPNDGITPITFFAEVEGVVDRVWLDLSEIRGSQEQEMTQTGEGIYQFTTTVPPGVAVGTKPVAVRARGAGVTVVNNITVNVLNFVSGFILDRLYYVDVDLPGQMLLLTVSQECDNGCEPLFLQVFKPGSSGKPDYEEEITEEERVISIENAEAGRWSYQVTQKRYSARMLSNRFARVSSGGAYNVTAATAGTGIVFGLVSDAQTANPIDNVRVSTTTGALTSTDGGYYILLTAAGVFSMNMQNPPTHKNEARSVSLMSGSQTEVNAFMLRSNFDDGTGDDDCFLSDLFGSSSQHADIFRIFRDSVLKQTDYGRGIVDTYYFHSPEVSSIIRQDHEIRRDLILLFLRFLPVLNTLVKGGEIHLTCDQKQWIERSLSRLKSSAGKELRQEIEGLLDDIETGKFMK